MMRRSQGQPARWVRMALDLIMMGGAISHEDDGGGISHDGGGISHNGVQPVSGLTLPQPYPPQPPAPHTDGCPPLRASALHHSSLSSLNTHHSSYISPCYSSLASLITHHASRSATQPLSQCGTWLFLAPSLITHHRPSS